MSDRMPWQDWEKAAESIHSLQELHRWLHETHLCYSVSRQVFSNLICFSWMKVVETLAKAMQSATLENAGCFRQKYTRVKMNV